MITKIDKSEIEAHYKVLNKIGNIGTKPQDGFTRTAWSDEETGAIKFFEKKSKEIGLITRYDEVGNLYARTNGNPKKFIQIGSHVDTVAKGGNYDGVAGIVAGFHAIKSILESKTKLKKGVELVIWRGEEAPPFDKPNKGCLAAFGILDKQILTRKYQDKTLKDWITSQGFNSSPIEKQKPTINKEEIAAHLELHIEQANSLEINKKQIGIVTSIRGITNLRVFIYGRFDHSGATNMGVKYRKDANLALANIIVELNKLIPKDKDLVQTIGIINSNKSVNEKYKDLFLNSINKVSGFGYFDINIRSNDNNFLKEYVELVKKSTVEISSKFSVKATIEELTTTDAIESMDNIIQSKGEDVCKKLGFSYQSIPSGASHDVSVLSNQTYKNGKAIPTGLIFIPCKDGISHNEKEFTSSENIKNGALVLANLVLELQ